MEPEARPSAVTVPSKPSGSSGPPRVLAKKRRSARVSRRTRYEASSLPPGLIERRDLSSSAEGRAPPTSRKGAHPPDMKITD